MPRANGVDQAFRVGGIDLRLAPEPCHRMTSRAESDGIEDLSLVFQHGVVVGPGYGVLVIQIVGPLAGQGRREGRRLAAFGTPDEGEDLRFGTRLVRREELRILRRAGGDALFDGPQRRAVIVAALGDVDKRIAGGLRLGFSVRSPQECDDLTAGTDQLRAEGRFAGTVRHAPTDSPLHSSGKIVAVADILEGAALRRDRCRQRNKQHRDDQREGNRPCFQFHVSVAPFVSLLICSKKDA